MKSTVPQYAAAEGISVVAAHKRLKRIGLRVKRGQLIDADAVNAKWRQVSDAKQGTRNPGGVKKPKAPAAASHAEPRVAEAKGSSLGDAQLAKELLSVREKQIKLKILEGKLVELAPINAFVAGMILRAQTELLRIGPELRDHLAIETDPTACEEMVVKRIHRALKALSEYRPNA